MKLVKNHTVGSSCVLYQSYCRLKSVTYLIPKMGYFPFKGCTGPSSGRTSFGHYLYFQEDVAIIPLRVLNHAIRMIVQRCIVPLFTGKENSKNRNEI